MTCLPGTDCPVLVVGDPVAIFTVVVGLTVDCGTATQITATARNGFVETQRTKTGRRRDMRVQSEHVCLVLLHT